MILYVFGFPEMLPDNNIISISSSLGQFELKGK